MKLLRKLGAIALIIALMSTVLAGCATEKNTDDTNNEDVNKNEVSSYVDDSYLVDAKWLSENLKNENVLILDARGDKLYSKGHIPGAISVAWPGFADVNGAPGDEGWGVVLDAEALSEKLSSIGVDNNKTIVVYADTKNGWGEDGRFVWMLRMAGVKNSKILNGGWNFWNANNYEVSKEAISPTPSSFKIEKLDDTVTIDTDDLNSKLDKVKILDTREKEEYDGATKYNEKRGGHLPNSVLLTFNDTLNEDGTFKSADQLEALFEKAGLNKDDKIVTYCTAGIRSAHLQIALEMMGYNNVRNYDASYYEWAANKSLEVEEKILVKDGYQYYTAEQLKNSIEKQKAVLVVDIQVEEEYNEHHIKGVIPTHAYPVKSDEGKAKLYKVLPKLEESNDRIVIVCPRGGGGAERTYDYLLEKGINKNRLFILENGQQGWPYDELLDN